MHRVTIKKERHTLKRINRVLTIKNAVFSFTVLPACFIFLCVCKKFTLGNYDDWPEERWADVSRPEWQEFVTGKLAASLAEKHVDGFFLDNADVYYVYGKDKIFKGLVSIISGLVK